MELVELFCFVGSVVCCLPKTELSMVDANPIILSDVFGEKSRCTHHRNIDLFLACKLNQDVELFFRANHVRLR